MRDGRLAPPNDVLPMDDLLGLPTIARDAASSTYKAERMLRRAESVGAGDVAGSAELDPDRVLLLPSVQFIYELVLARMELRAFHLDWQMDVGMRSVPIGRQTVPTDFLRRTAYFRSVGIQESDYAQVIRFNRMNSVNQYLTHWIYPYKGKFHPQMIRALLNILGMKRGDTVLDPFVGSGTTLLEAMLLGINSIGVDASPLCVLQCEVKTGSVAALANICEVKGNVLAAASTGEAAVWAEIGMIEHPATRRFCRLAALVALSDATRRGRGFTASLEKNMERMLLSVQDLRDLCGTLGLKPGEVNVHQGDARRLPIADSSVDGVVTSPPYSIALDYVANDSHSLSAMGENLSEMRGRLIGVRGTGSARIDQYNSDLRSSLGEIARVQLRGSQHAALKPFDGNGHFDQVRHLTREILEIDVDSPREVPVRFPQDERAQGLVARPRKVIAEMNPDDVVCVHVLGDEVLKRALARRLDLYSLRLTQPFGEDVCPLPAQAEGVTGQARQYIAGPQQVHCQRLAENGRYLGELDMPGEGVVPPYLGDAREHGAQQACQVTYLMQRENTSALYLNRALAHGFTRVCGEPKHPHLRWSRLARCSPMRRSHLPTRRRRHRTGPDTTREPLASVTTRAARQVL